VTMIILSTWVLLIDKCLCKEKKEKDNKKIIFFKGYLFIYYFLAIVAILFCRIRVVRN
jgi:hypothetical protein